MDSHSSRKRRGLLTFAAALLCTFGLTASAHAMTTYNVTAGDATSLRNAIDSANSDGDDSTVNVPAGTYNLDPNDPGMEIFGDGSFTLVGAGARSTIIDGGGGPVTAGDTDTTDDTIFTIKAFCKCPASANATFSGITVQGANPDEEGGAFRVENAGPGQQASLHLLDSTITGNQAGSSDGGGIYNEGTLVVDRVTFTNNFSDADGSAIANVNENEGVGAIRGINLIATATITNSTFTNNTADSNAGGAGQGVIFTDGGKVTIINSTIDHNTNLDGSGDGYGPTGGLAADEDGTIDVVNTIVSNNTASPEQEVTTAPRGESAATRGSGPTIAANCAVDPEFGGTITSQGHNIETATDCGFTAAGDQQNTDPKLGTLANNGGQMDTLALLSGSPAIDHADAANCPATDEIGTTRPQGPACDVGAFEVVVPPPPAPPAAPPVTPPAKPAAPKVGVAGVRRACVSRSFHIRFHIATTASVKSVVVKLDGRRIKSTSKVSFTLTINSKKLKAGRHRLTITATDSAGQTTTSHRTFSVCKAAKPRRKAAPRFTG